jgi:hypothetical protein
MAQMGYSCLICAANSIALRTGLDRLVGLAQLVDTAVDRSLRDFGQRRDASSAYRKSHPAILMVQSAQDRRQTTIWPPRRSSRYSPQATDGSDVYLVGEHARE